MAVKKAMDLIIDTTKQENMSDKDIDFDSWKNTSSLEKINKKISDIEELLEKRCWEGYEPTPGKKAYEKGSCQPIKKQEDIEVAPKKSKNRKTYIENFGKSDVQIDIFDNLDIELTIGEDVGDDTEIALVETILNKSYEEVLEKGKEWSPKAKHKSDKGGLTAAGRASYNKATGGNLKAPQPGGGPRKRSFCARNAGQIRMHNIDCRKTPEKRACKARRRWKC